MAVCVQAVEAHRVGACRLELGLPVADAGLVERVRQEVRDHAVVGPRLAESVGDVALDASRLVAQERADCDVLVCVDRRRRRDVGDHAGEGACFDTTTCPGENSTSALCAILRGREIRDVGMEWVR